MLNVISMMQKTTNKVIKVGNKTYHVGTRETINGKFYDVNIAGSMTINTFKKKSDIQYKYPTLKGKLKGV